MLNVLINNDTINPFQSIIAADDLRKIMLQYFKSRYPESISNTYEENNVLNRMNPRVFGKQFGFILRHSKKPFKMIDAISLRRGLVYKFNFTKLRKYLENVGLYEAKTETQSYKINYPSYLKVVSQPFNDALLMDRLYCDFFLYDFIHVDWKTTEDNNNNNGNSSSSSCPPPLVFISVLTFPANFAMSLTKDAIHQAKGWVLANNSDEAVKISSCVDLFKQFKAFLQKISNSENINRIIRSAFLHIRGNLSLLHFGVDMERFLFSPELGKKIKTNKRAMYHIYMDKVQTFLRDKLKKQFDIQYKQLDIQGRSADMEYMDFTDQEPTTDEEKDNAEMQRRKIKRAEKTHKAAILRKLHKKIKRGERSEIHQALCHWENEDIEDRTNGIHDDLQADVINHLRSYHKSIQRKNHAENKAKT